MFDLFPSFSFDDETVVAELGLLAANMVACGLFFMLLSALRIGDKSWYLTLYSSAATSTVGVIFFRSVMRDGLEASIMNENELSRFIALFFIGYCLMDLTLGSVYYEQQITYADGWMHHSLYVVICGVLLYRRMTGLFAVALIEELPIIILSFFEVQNKRKPSLLFGALYFVTRCFFHLNLIYAAAPYSKLVFAAGVVLLRWHLITFQSWVRGYLLRSSTRKRRLPFNAKIAFFLAAVGAQAVAHVLLATSRVLVLRQVGQMRAMTAHVIICAYFVYQLLLIVQDVYTQNFIMSAIGKKKIIYNISWEDPAIDHRVLKCGPEDVVLTISSAGCNVLDYVLEGPKKVIAVDMNGAQLALLELKLAAIRCCTHDEFFRLFGESEYGLFAQIYESRLRPHLSTDAAEFWDANGSIIRNNLMFAGASGLMARLLQPLIFTTGAARLMVRTAQSGEGAPKSLVSSPFFKLACSIVKAPALWSWLAPLGGVPLEQLNLLAERPELFAERLVEVMCKRMWPNEHFANNYFYYGYVVGRFSRECCPRYLRAEHFATLRARVDIVKPFHGTWAEGAEALAPGEVTVASLLDSMDWMPEQMVGENIGRLVACMQRGNARIFWRSFAPEVHSAVLAHLRDKSGCAPILVPDYDRVGWYLSQYWTTLDPKYTPARLLCKGTGVSYVNSMLDDALVMVKMGSYGLTGALGMQRDVRAFYRSQGRRYDGFREALLPDRDIFMQFVMPWVTNPQTWVSVGCGTARDIEFVLEHVRACNTKVYLVDLSDALLDMAKERVHKHGLSDRVVCIEGDINDPLTLAKLPAGGADFVTCSYCLTMIPPWEKALQTMLGLTKTGGYLGLIDFTVKARPGVWQSVYRWWFANDGVYFNRKHVDWLRGCPQLEEVWYKEAQGRVPYTLLMPSHYTFCGKKK